MINEFIYEEYPYHNNNPDMIIKLINPNITPPK
jgi:hypothetical protein